MEFETILLQREGAIAYVILNRVEQRNALNSKMLQELSEVCIALDRDEEVRVIVIRSACPGVFSASADVKEREGMTTTEQVRRRRLLARSTYESLQRIEKPMICAVNGKNYGGGCEIATACDFIISSENASFRYPEVIYGTLGATQRIPRSVGKSRAKYYLLTGKTISAEEAYRIGLTAVLVPEQEFEETVRTTAETIASYPPLAIRLTKKSIDVGMEVDMISATDFEIQAIETIISNQEWKKGVQEWKQNMNKSISQTGYKESQ
ncbi:enoyl-CoA hydratase/isomerase family protein [Brevibacillus sp. NRS-1366]|uniref:enoyl-CoA hydratase/isomerase family protein n=1 Tax=Brevibacillus sp. NRS-1366 TaxID=3233899 RepID=UPI003D1FCCA3